MLYFSFIYVFLTVMFLIYDLYFSYHDTVRIIKEKKEIISNLIVVSGFVFPFGLLSIDVMVPYFFSNHFNKYILFGNPIMELFILFLQIFIFEIYFYIAHRYVGHKIHKESHFPHHEVTEPISIFAYQTSIIENIVNSFPFIVSIFFGYSLASIHLFFFIIVAFSLFSHTFSPKGKEKFHGLHHKYCSYNYGFGLIMNIDKLMGTQYNKKI
jgi:sterol desaturase/sphingolipid hydroxylase (fatty acid hydroxylase superfamily)